MLQTELVDGAIMTNEHKFRQEEERIPRCSIDEDSCLEMAKLQATSVDGLQEGRLNDDYIRDSSSVCKIFTDLDAPRFKQEEDQQQQQQSPDCGDRLEPPPSPPNEEELCLHHRPESPPYESLARVRRARKLPAKWAQSSIRPKRARRSLLLTKQHSTSGTSRVRANRSANGVMSGRSEVKQGHEDEHDGANLRLKCTQESPLGKSASGGYNSAADDDDDTRSQSDCESVFDGEGHTPPSPTSDLSVTATTTTLLLPSDIKQEAIRLDEHPEEGKIDAPGERPFSRHPKEFASKHRTAATTTTKTRLNERQLQLLDNLIDVVRVGTFEDFVQLLGVKQEDKEAECSERNLLNAFVNGQTLLHYSLLYGRDLAWCKQLVLRGANPNLANRAGWHPVHLAAFSCSQETMAYLLSCLNGSSR